MAARHEFDDNDKYALKWYTVEDDKGDVVSAEIHIFVKGADGKYSESVFDHDGFDNGALDFVTYEDVVKLATGCRTAAKIRRCKDTCVLCMYSDSVMSGVDVASKGKCCCNAVCHYFNAGDAGKALKGLGGEDMRRVCALLGRTVCGSCVGRMYETKTMVN